MSNQLGINIVRFIALILIQVLICNNVLLFGFVNPYPYIIFVLLYAMNTDRWQFLLASFALGLTLDMFQNSGGTHAAACLVIAFIRPVVLQSCFGLNYLHQNLKLNNVEFKGLLLYVIIMSFIHHLVVFTLEVFEIQHIQYITLQTLFSGIFSCILILISLSLFLKKKT